MLSASGCSWHYDIPWGPAGTLCIEGTTWEEMSLHHPFFPTLLCFSVFVHLVNLICI